MNNTTHPHVGQNIKVLRELRNYTQEYVADKIGVSKSRYVKLEQEEEINTGLLYKIAEVLHTNIFKILSFEGQNYFDINHNKFENGQSIGNNGNIHQTFCTSTETEQELLILLRTISAKL